MTHQTNFTFQFPTLYARSKNGAVLTWDIEIEGNKFRTITGQETGQKIISEWTVCKSKNIGKANETSDDSQAQLEASSKWKKKLKSGGYFEDKKDIDKPLSFIEPMLAHPLFSEKTKKNKKTGTEETVLIDRTNKIKLPGAMLDRKYNGMRQVASSVGPYSRKGEEIKTAPHIYNSLSSLFENEPPLVLDGELYNHELRHQLNELLKIVRTTADHRITPELLAKSERVVRYYVYDGYGFTTRDGAEITEDTPCIQRRDALKEYLKDIPYVVVVPYVVVSTMEEIMEYYKQYLEDGYEGGIVRNSDAPYQHFRTDDLIKVKPFDDMEVTILDIIDPGSGNWGGSGKTATVKMDNGKIFTATFKGSYETAVQILKDKDKWIGERVTGTYTGWTGKGTPNSFQIDPNNCFRGD